ncbi:MAG TPA: 3-oxoacyl-[acyl-carrier-protein] reductase [Elusimicrobia bacterium]|nr:3-oxoacyl-[acyl-carrier-protein] reductase [Elusimicrobiota bacterium]HBT61747.1 3-oxoacyl-[acyl-carrier-protein] reductase [Elusimicrobiota bacterium]
MTEPNQPARPGGGRLAGRVAIVTGAAQGIGLAIAELFGGEGAALVMVDVDQARVEQAAQKLAAASSGTLAVQADVSRAEDCDRVVKAALDKFGKLDILVNNAGITRDNLILRLSEQDWDLVLGVNLKGAFNFTKAVSRAMIKARAGRIINIASIVGQQGNAGQANYSASKGGLIALTKTCAREFASRNILVNAIAPGFIRTRMTDAIPPEAREKLAASILLGRLGEPEDIARAALFLAGDDSSYITGQVLGVNGGMNM